MGIESQQRIDVLTRSLQELRDLHRQMVEAGIGQGDDSDDDDDEEEEEDLEKPMSLTEDVEEVFELEDDDDVVEDCISFSGQAGGGGGQQAAVKRGSISFSSSVLSPNCTRKHGHT